MSSLGFSSLPFPTGARRTYFSGGAGVHGRDAEKKPNAPRSTVGHPLAGSPGTGFILLLPSLLPLLLSSPFRPRRRWPLACFLRGATRLASKGWFCAERKVLPASAGASLLLSLGTSLTLGCAKRPLVVRSPSGGFLRAWKGLSPPRLGEESAVGDIPRDLGGRGLPAGADSGFGVAPEQCHLTSSCSLG